MLELAWGGFKIHTDLASTSASRPTATAPSNCATRWRPRRCAADTSTTSQLPGFADRLNLDPERDPPPDPIPGPVTSAPGAISFPLAARTAGDPSRPAAAGHRIERHRSSGGAAGDVLAVDERVDLLWTERGKDLSLSGRRDSNPRPLDPQPWTGSTVECCFVSVGVLTSN
jgi:hypothetical protein